MSISEAAYWIASEGGTVSFDLCNLEKWQQAFFILQPLMSSGQISVVGRRHGRGLPESIPAACFAGIAVAYPYSNPPTDLLLCKRPHLQCYGIMDAEHWENTFSDCLMGDDLYTPEYTHLQVSNFDLGKAFPFSNSSSSGPLTTEPPKTAEVPKRKAGRKPKYDWQEAELYVFQQLDARGDFDDHDQLDGWKCQADLARSVADYFSKKPSGKVPVDSVIRDNIRSMVDAWRKKNAAGNRR
jgi:hypothetical protein